MAMYCSSHPHSGQVPQRSSRCSPFAEEVHLLLLAEEASFPDGISDIEYQSLGTDKSLERPETERRG